MTLAFCRWKILPHKVFQYNFYQKMQKFSFNIFIVFCAISSYQIKLIYGKMPIAPPGLNFDIEPFLDPDVGPSNFLALRNLSHSSSISGRDSKSLLFGGASAAESAGESVFRQLSTFTTTAYISRRSFNTSCAFTIPLITFTLPQQGTDTGTFLSNQAVFALFGTLVVLMELCVPVLFTGIRSPTLTGRSNVAQSQNTLERLMSKRPTFDFMGSDTKYKIGLDSTSCLLKTICEAHRSPENKNYGILAIPFQIFFPPPEKDTSEDKNSAAQIAASIGKDSTKDCGKEYKCFFDVLDLAIYFRNWYLISSGHEDMENNDIL